MVDVQLLKLSSALFVHGTLGTNFTFETNGSAGVEVFIGVRKKDFEMEKREWRANVSSYLDGRPNFPPPKPLKGKGNPKGSRTSGEYMEQEGEFNRDGEFDRVWGRRDPTGFKDDLGFMV